MSIPSCACLDNEEKRQDMKEIGWGIGERIAAQVDNTHTCRPGLSLVGAYIAVGMICSLSDADPLVAAMELRDRLNQIIDRNKGSSH